MLVSTLALEQALGRLSRKNSPCVCMYVEIHVHVRLNDYCGISQIFHLLFLHNQVFYRENTGEYCIVIKR